MLPTLYLLPAFLKEASNLLKKKKKKVFLKYKGTVKKRKVPQDCWLRNKNILVSKAH